MLGEFAGLSADWRTPPDDGSWLLDSEQELMVDVPTRNSPAGDDVVPGPTSAHSSMRDQRRAIILVVERDPNIRELEAYFLEEAGYTVEFAEDGVGELALARQLRPGIIITEILVPKLDGLALCRAIKQDASLRNTVVLIFSLLAAHGRAREAGADAFLMKPLAEHRLITTVRELLAQHHAASSEENRQ